MGLTKNLGWLSKYITADSTGKIGIGTASPNYGLNVVNSDLTLSGIVSNRFIGLRKENNTLPGYLGLLGGDNGDSALIIGYNSAGTQTLQINASTSPTYFNGGNVGIGTQNPQEKFEVAGFNGNIRLYGKSGITNNSISSNIYYNGSGWVRDVSGGANSIVLHPTNGLLFNTTAATSGDVVERMRITSGGNVQFSGISTLPTDNNSLYASSSNNYMYVQGGSVGLALYSSGGRNNGVIVSEASSSIIFNTNNAERAQVGSNGNLIVGVSGGNTGLILRQATSIDRFQIFVGAGGSYIADDNYIKSYNTDLHFLTGGTGTTEAMRITTSGTTLFRRQTTLDPSYAAGFEGAIFFKTAANGNNTVNFFNASTTYVASIVTNASSIVYGTGSDYRLKEDLKDFNGLEKISKIKVYDFKFIKEGDRMDGVLAHELQEIVPYAVTGEKDELDDKGNIKIQNVDYSKLTPILIKAIQELTERIKTLENK